MQVKFTGKDQLKAGDIGKSLTSFQILNPDLVICNMDKSVEIDMELTIEKGRGYIPSEENKKSTSPLGTIFIDSVFTPIKNVNFSVENFRVEQKTDYEKLVFEIVTDGSIHPKDALTEAAKILFNTLCCLLMKMFHLNKRNLIILMNLMKTLYICVNY